MSDDIFKDIWDKLAAIYSRMSQLTQAVAAGAGGKLSGIGGKMQALAERIGKLFQSPRFLRALAIGGAVASAAITLGKVVYNATRSQLASLREYSKANGLLAKSFAISDFADFMRSFKQGFAVANTTDQLNQAFTRLKDELAPISATLTNAWNRILTIGTKATTLLVSVMKSVLGPIMRPVIWLLNLIVDGIEWIIDWLQTLADLIPGNKERREREQAEEKRREREQLSIPVTRMFNSVLRRDFGAIRDTRPSMF